ncbi:MAG: zinc metalloprotease, partial [Chitinophagia bacterium]|nr:zinc metalloprotease [Chitinophagia bacterium]
MSAAAQERCATVPSGTGHKQTLQSAETAELPPVITVPVVVHILWRTPEEDISDDQVRSQLESLNADFSRGNSDISSVPAVFAARSASCGIRFVLATADPDGRPTNG